MPRQADRRRPSSLGLWSGLRGLSRRPTVGRIRTTFKPRGIQGVASPWNGRSDPDLPAGPQFRPLAQRSRAQGIGRCALCRMGINLCAADAAKDHGSPGAALGGLDVGLGPAAQELELVCRAGDIRPKGRAAHVLAVRAVADGDLGGVDHTGECDVSAMTRPIYAHGHLRSRRGRPGADRRVDMAGLATNLTAAGARLPQRVKGLREWPPRANIACRPISTWIWIPVSRACLTGRADCGVLDGDDQPPRMGPPTMAREGCRKIT